MRPFALACIAVAFAVGLPSRAEDKTLASLVALERERSDPAPELQQQPSSQTRTDSAAAKRHSFNFFSGGESFDFSLNGGWNGNGIHFQMKPSPKTLLHHFWVGPFKLLSRGRALALWLAGSLAIAALFQPQLRRAQEELRRAPGRSIVVGIVWNLAFWALLAACALLCLILIGVPLLVILVAFHFVLGVFGMTLAFSVVGEWLARRINQSAVSVYVAILIGACFLGLLRALPIFGSLVWLAAGCFGVGATLATAFRSGTSTSTTYTPALPA